MKRCIECGKEIKVYRKKLCNNCYRKKYLGKNCLDCGIRVYSVCKRCFKCSRLALKGIPNPKNLGNNNAMYRGGRVENAHGYIFILVGPDTYRLEHRVVMEKYLGRDLKVDEVVHHLNGDKQDNRIENLEIMNPCQHIQHHWDNEWMDRRVKI